MTGIEELWKKVKEDTRITLDGQEYPVEKFDVVPSKYWNHKAFAIQTFTTKEGKEAVLIRYFLLKNGEWEKTRTHPIYDEDELEMVFTAARKLQALR